jgi:hypothetical protein
MRLRNAALFAVVGMILWVIPVTLEMIEKLAALGQGAVSAATAVSSVIQFVAILSLLVFFFVFHRAQS